MFAILMQEKEHFAIKFFVNCIRIQNHILLHFEFLVYVNFLPFCLNGFLFSADLPAAFCQMFPAFPFVLYQVVDFLLSLQPIFCFRVINFTTARSFALLN